MKHLSLLSRLAEKHVKISCSESKLRIEAPPDALTPQDKEDLSSLKKPILDTFQKYQLNSNFDISNLSDQQLGIWYLDNLNGSSSQYNIVARYDISGELDASILEDCLKALVDRHDALKTNILIDDDNIPWQLVNRSHRFSLDLIDITASDETPEKVFQEYEEAEYGRAFALASDLLIYAALVTCIGQDNRSTSLIINIHHVAFDGWSLGIFIDELKRLYSAGLRGESHQLDPLVVSYRDYSRWQKGWLQSDAINTEKVYWSKQLKDIPEVHSLPLDFPRPAALGNAGSHYREMIPPLLAQEVSQFAQANNTSVFVTWYTLFSLYISRLSNTKDVPIGTAVANREIQHTKEVIGLFINTVVLRMRLADTLSLVEALSHAKAIVNQAYAHQSIPLRLMIELSKVTPSLSYSPLYQINFSYANIEPIALDKAVLMPAPYKVRFAKFDLSLTVENAEDISHLNWEFNKDLFVVESISDISTNFIYFCSEIIKQKESDIFRQKICHPDLFDSLTHANKTDRDFKKSPLFFLEFEALASALPTHLAISDKDKTYTYEALNKYSNQIAHFLHDELSICRDNIIAICLNRSADMVAFMLAIMKAGAAYLPLDPNFPTDRLQYMLSDAKAICLITTRSLADQKGLLHDHYLLLDEAETANKIKQKSYQNIRQTNLSGKDLAYVIYTSGSTGRPKGVMVEHRSLANFLYSMQAAPGMFSEDCLLAVTSTSFDIHILELFLPLICGASLVVADSESTKNPVALIQLIDTHHINMMQATPTSWSMLFDAGWQAQRKFKALCGGESLGATLLQRFLSNDQIALWNMYGPTETTVWSAVKPIHESVTIGNPIANTQLFLLDDALNPVPPGCIAELYIGGQGLARGYLNAPDLTREKFIEPVVIGEKSYRLYKTGDLCSQNNKGEISFIARADNQVKIRGFRIELAEIEKVILASEYVNDACVVIKHSQTSPFICAYITQDKSSDGETSALRGYLSRQLPDYMIPTRIEVLGKFPETNNRKVDRKALSEQPIDYTSSPVSRDISEKDRVLIDAMCEVLGLGLGSLTIDDNFYHVGGDSINALRYIAAVKRKGYIFSLQDLIKSQCVRNLSHHVLDYEAPETKQSFFFGNLEPTLDHRYILAKEKLLSGYTINGLMSMSSPLNKVTFAKAFTATTMAHEVVRSKFTCDRANWHMNVVDPGNHFYWADYQLDSVWESPNTGSQLKKILEDIQNKLNLAGAIHYAFALIHSSDKKQKLLFAANHSVVDGYSNGIFLEDLFLNYHQLLNHRSEFPTANQIPSIDEWSSAIKKHIDSPSFKHNFEYWNNIDWTAIRSLPSDIDDTLSDSEVIHGSSATVTQTLDPALTNTLRSLVPDLLNISHLEFVMAVVTRTLQEHFSLPKVYLHVIDAGRGFYNEMLQDQQIDVSRVVSLLAELTPRFLLVERISALNDLEYIKTAVNKFRASEKQAQTFMLLKYGSSDHAIADAMKEFPEPDVRLNFLGMTNLIKENENSKLIHQHLPAISRYNSLISPVTVPADAPLERRLFLAWHVVDEQLEMNWHYSKQLHTEECIRRAATACKARVERVLRAVQSLKKASHDTTTAAASPSLEL